MISPPPLKAGERIALVAPARKISPVELAVSISIMEGWGFEVVCGPNLYNTQDQYAGSDEERLQDLQWALDDESIRAVVCARGGYGTLRILDAIDFTAFIRHPKWIVGYSDITVIHSHVNTVFGIETLHAAMPINFERLGQNSSSLLSLKNALTDQPLRYAFPAHPFDRPGSVAGEMIGGNLSILYSLNGSKSFGDTSGKLLFIEDLDEYLYHVDRMMQNLLRSGKISGLSGFLVGGMDDMRDNEVPFGKDALEIVRDTVDSFQFPTAFGIEAGHGQKNHALILGRKAFLETGTKTILEFAGPGE